LTAARTAPLPGQPQDGDGPVFAEAWEAQAFAMAVMLHEKGVFTWPEWTAALAEEIKAAQAAGDPDLGDTYYQHWLRVLERLVVEKGVAGSDLLQETAHAWEEAARATPHGQPIVLEHARRLHPGHEPG
jgi:nitrile hydratase accessory protein